MDPSTNRRLERGGPAASCRVARAGRPGDAAAEGAGRALRRRTCSELACGALALALAASCIGRLAGFGDAYLPKAFAGYLTAVVLIVGALPAHAPHRRFGAANRTTLARLVGSLLLGAAIGEPAFANETVLWSAIAFATAIAVLDAADGPLARASGLASDFGARFDMETDAWLMLVLGVLIWQTGRAGPWVIAAGLMRYAFVAAGRVRPWLARPLPPSLRRKAVCVLGIAGHIACLGPIVPPVAAGALAAAFTLAIAGSFALDVAWLARSRLAVPEALR